MGAFKLHVYTLNQKRLAYFELNYSWLSQMTHALLSFAETFYKVVQVINDAFSF